MNSSDYQIVTADEIREGDILLGPANGNTYTKFQSGWEVINPPRSSRLYVSIDLKSTKDGHKVSGWSTQKDRKYAIQYRELKYDPMQQGDTDEDI